VSHDIQSRLREQRITLLKKPRGGVLLDRDTLVLLLADASDAITSSISGQLRPPKEIVLDEVSLEYWWAIVNCGELRRYPIRTIEALVASLLEKFRGDDGKGWSPSGVLQRSRRRWIEAVKGALGSSWRGSAEEAQAQLRELGIYAAGMFEAGEALMDLSAYAFSKIEAGEVEGIDAAERWRDAAQGFRELQQDIREKQNGD
jgi:hypothetical protein